MSFLSLLPELIKVIISFLGPLDVIYFSRTCKYLYSLSKDFKPKVQKTETFFKHPSKNTKVIKYLLPNKEAIGWVRNYLIKDQGPNILCQECFRINGQLHGPVRFYDDEGKLYEETYYRYNMKEGSHKSWNNQGQLLWTCYYSEGKLHGLSKKLNGETGEPILLTWYKNGQRNGLCKYWGPDSKETYYYELSYKDDFYDGPCKTWLIKEGRYFLTQVTMYLRGRAHLENYIITHNPLEIKKERFVGGIFIPGSTQVLSDPQKVLGDLT